MSKNIDLTNSLLSTVHFVPLDGWAKSIQNRSTSIELILYLNVGCWYLSRKNSGLTPSGTTQETWSVDGSPLFRVVSKLKILNKQTKNGDKNPLIPQELRFRKSEHLERGDDRMGVDPLNSLLHKEELDLQAELGSWLAHEENQLRQKGRVL